VTRSRRFLLLLALSLTLTTGCFGKHEIDDLAMVMAVGLDPGQTPGSVRITAQIARPSDVRGQTGAPTAGSGEPIWTVSGEGDTIMAAIRSIARFSSRRVFWAHNQIIIINEKLARRGIKDALDFFSRNHELRMRTWVVVCSEEARKMVTLKTGLEMIPGVSLHKLFRYSQVVSEAPRTDMRTLSAAYLSESTHPVLARVQSRSRLISVQEGSQEHGSNPQVELSGTAVFKKDKMLGWLDMEQSRGLLWFIEPVESRIVVLPCPSGDPEQNESKNGKISLEIKHNTFEVTPHYDGKKISFTAHLNADIDLVEVGCETNLSNYDLMKQLESKVRAKLRREIDNTVQAAQHTYGVDILELGKIFHNVYPAEWKKISKRWSELFPTVDVRVEIEAGIKSPVLLQKPLQPGK